MQLHRGHCDRTKISGDHRAISKRQVSQTGLPTALPTHELESGRAGNIDLVLSTASPITHRRRAAAKIGVNNIRAARLRHRDGSRRQCQQRDELGGIVVEFG